MLQRAKAEVQKRLSQKVLHVHHLGRRLHANTAETSARRCVDCARTLGLARIDAIATATYDTCSGLSVRLLSCCLAGGRSTQSRHQPMGGVIQPCTAAEIRLPFQRGHMHGRGGDQVLVQVTARHFRACACRTAMTHCTQVVGQTSARRYIFKGSDRASVTAESAAETPAGVPANVRAAIDEIRQFQDLRYIGACEACWRIFEFRMFDRSHAVIRLTTHLPGAAMQRFMVCSVPTPSISPLSLTNLM